VIGSAPRALAAVVRHQPRQRVGRARLVEPHGLVLECGDILRQRLGRAHVAEVFERVPHIVVELGAVDIKPRPAFARYHRESQRQRRMGNVGAADVESPGDVLRVRHHQRVGTKFPQLGADGLELVGGVLTGELDVAQRHRTGRRCRAVAPQRIDRIAVGRHQLGTRVGASLAQFLHLVGGVQPGIVAEPGAGFQVLRQPLIGRGVHQMLDGKNRLIDLRVCLHGVAAVHEHGRALAQHDGRAGRAGEAREPCQSLLARRQIFVLLAVGTRHHETVEAAALELGAQGGGASRAFRALARIVKGLEAGFEHGAAL
jgi:hypothetical protein